MDPFVGEIRLWALNFAPQGWALCQGQLMSISQNAALFSLIGTFFGGDGRINFGLPNLQGKVTVGMGQGMGLSSYVLGQAGGAATVTMQPNQMPVHYHTLPTGTAGVAGGVPSASTYLSPEPGSRTAPGIPLSASQEQYSSGSVMMNPQTAGVAGGNQPHNNMAPYLTLNYCIALQGIFPQRQ